MSLVRRLVVCAVASGVGIGCPVIPAQENSPETAERTTNTPTIPDEPKTIDPATFLPAVLTTKSTVDFTGSTLANVIDWLRENQELVVLFEQQAAAQIGVFPSDPVYERLRDEPIYLLLNRLRSLGLAWYVEGDVLHITSKEVAESRLTTMPFTIGDLFDAGFTPSMLNDVVQNTVAPEAWLIAGGMGDISFLGDVMLVRQTDPLQRQIQGLLAALRQHGRRTFVADPPDNAQLRHQLGEQITFQVQEMPLESAVEQLAEQTGADIRLNRTAVRDANVRERTPVSVSLMDRKLETVLQAMLLNVDLSWIVRDGVIWITNEGEAESYAKTAVFDVRDLSRNFDEASALTDAIMSQTDPAWLAMGGVGAIEFTKPGTMVVRATERVLDQVLNLLETYRTALRSSKPRGREQDQSGVVVTIYYGMYADMARDLQQLIPRLVRPETWRDAERPNAPGEIYLSSSTPVPLEGRPSGSAANGRGAGLLIDRAVLIVRQTRAAHDEIREVIRRAEHGDAMAIGATGMGGMGGFGGGFFSVAPDK